MADDVKYRQETGAGTNTIGLRRRVACILAVTAPFLAAGWAQRGANLATLSPSSGR